MMSGHATIETAVEATRIGALDFLEKPIALQKLLKAVEQGLTRGKHGPVPVRSMPSSYHGAPMTGGYCPSALYFNWSVTHSLAGMSSRGPR